MFRAETYLLLIWIYGCDIFIFPVILVHDFQNYLTALLYLLQWDKTASFQKEARDTREA